MGRKALDLVQIHALQFLDGDFRFFAQRENGGNDFSPRLVGRARLTKQCFQRLGNIRGKGG